MDILLHVSYKLNSEKSISLIQRIRRKRCCHRKELLIRSEFGINELILRRSKISQVFSNEVLLFQSIEVGSAYLHYLLK